MTWRGGVAVALASACMAGVAGATPVFYTEPPVADSTPLWSADGTKLAFFRYDRRLRESWTMYVMGAKGGAKRTPFALPGGAGFPILSPDWSKVVFNIDVDTLRIMNVDGSGFRDIAAEPRPGTIVWSPDSRSLAFATYNDRIVVLAVDGGGAKEIADGGESPAWSPDAERLAFLSNSKDIAVVNRDGTGRRTVVVGEPERSGPPGWSPDGGRLAFAGRDGLLKVVGLDGTLLRSFDGSFYIEAPNWSPDGEKILVHDGRGLSVFNLHGKPKRFNFQGGASWAPSSAQFTISSRGQCSAIGISIVSVESRVIRRLTLGCRILGSRRADSIYGTQWKDIIEGLSGDDELGGGDEKDTLYGGPGRDLLRGGDGSTDGADLLLGGPGNDDLYGGPAPTEDSVHDDVLLGGTGDDRLSGGPGRDALYGQAGDDVLFGGKGADLLRGGPGRDTIHAHDQERDTVDCGTGRHDVVFADRVDRVSRSCEIIRPR